MVAPSRVLVVRCRRHQGQEPADHGKEVRFSARTRSTTSATHAQGQANESNAPGTGLRAWGRVTAVLRCLSATTTRCQRAESHDGEAPRCAELAQTSTRLAPAWAKGGVGDT